MKFALRIASRRITIKGKTKPKIQTHDSTYVWSARRSVGRDRSVGIATGYGTDGRGIESQ